MSPDDAEYSALLQQLLADSATSRNARVHSWIEHQYDFVLAEHPSIDRPDSPLLPRPSNDYDALFFPTKSDDNDFEEQERVRALRFIVQEMAHWKSHANSSPRLSSDKVALFLFFNPSHSPLSASPSSSSLPCVLHDPLHLIPPHALPLVLHPHLPPPLLHQHPLL